MFLLPLAVQPLSDVSEGLRNVEKKTEKNKNRDLKYHDQETGKAIIYSNKKTASPMFKTRSDYLSNQHSRADFTTGIV